MNKKTLALAVALTLGSGTAAALNIDFTLLDARWTDAVGGTITYLAPTEAEFGDPANIRWGDGGADPFNTDSGYDFDARDVPFSEQDGTVFELGTYVHQNFPISAGNSITKVTLDILADVTIGLTEYTGVTFSFDFVHDETPNGNGTDCPYDPATLTDALVVGNNAGACGDYVQILNDPTNPILGDITLQILGFAAEDTTSPLYSDFFSGEGTRNPAVLLATFDVPTPPTGTPTPAPLALMGLGLAGLAAARRKRLGSK